ncbi:MAG: T9SS type A sorting domain-containing protein [Bacteroidota bacterium]
MKKLYVTLILFLFFSSGFLFGQNPLVKQWDKRFGGTGNDELFSFQQTSDGGFILGGFSSSGINGDKTQNIWGSAGDRDYWIVKIDSLGNKQWDKDFGGIYYDYLTSLLQTADGGYILGGSSLSGISGDKTQANWDTICNPGCTNDYWIVKIDSSGNTQWDKDFGGTSWDYLTSLIQTDDGGYLLGGYSKSGITGNKSQPNWDSTGISYDYWIIKIDSLGSKQWDKVFGGTSWDYLSSLQQTFEGGYILGGNSYSNISGDKTQPLWDTCTNCPAKVDYWIVKIDSLGNKQWDKDFGGSDLDYFSSLQQTADRGYILGGKSRSGISGDKTQSIWDTCSNCFFKGDFWIVKIDSLGNKQWDRDFGGTLDEDEFENITQTTDGGYLIAGSSYSPISGNKTENNLGEEQTWIVKTDSLGIIQWDKTIFTTGHDELGRAIQLNNGCYAVANSTYGGIGGYKTQPNWDTASFPYTTPDYWIIKFCDTTFTTSLTPALSKGEEVAIAPNPFTNDITVTIQNHPEPSGIKHATFTVKNILGQIVFTFSQVPNFGKGFYGQTLNLSFLSKGIYLLEATIDNERIVKKIVKE